MQIKPTEQIIFQNKKPTIGHIDKFISILLKSIDINQCSKKNQQDFFR